LADCRPQGPLPFFRSFGRDGRVPAVPNVATESLPQRHFPLTVLADDPPRGSILLVSDQASLALEVQRILREAGYRTVGPAGSAQEATRLIERRSIDGAVVDSGFADIGTIERRLVQEGIPFVRVGTGLTVKAMEAFAPAPGDALSVSRSAMGMELIEAIERVLSSRRAARSNFYPVPPPQEAWPRIFPQL